MRQKKLTDVRDTLGQLASEFRLLASPHAIQKLSTAERRALVSAATLLESAEVATKEAYRIVKKRDDKRQARANAILQEMQVNFGLLQSLNDRVAFVAVTDERRHLNRTVVNSPDQFGRLFAEAMRVVARNLAERDMSTPAAALVSDVWDRFSANKAHLAAGYAYLTDHRAERGRAAVVQAEMVDHVGDGPHVEDAVDRHTG